MSSTLNECIYLVCFVVIAFGFACLTLLLLNLLRCFLGPSETSSRLVEANVLTSGLPRPCFGWIYWFGIVVVVVVDHKFSAKKGHFKYPCYVYMLFMVLQYAICSRSWQNYLLTL